MLTIDLILTYILARTLSASPPRFREVELGPPLPPATARGRATRVPRRPVRLASVYADTQCRPLLGLKNRSLVFLRRDDLTTYESRRKTGNWRTGSQEEKGCISPPPTSPPTQSTGAVLGFQKTPLRKSRRGGGRQGDRGRGVFSPSGCPGTGLGYPFCYEG